MPFVSNGAFIFGVFRLYDLDKREINVIPKENVGLSQDNVSKLEAQWVYHLCRDRGDEIRAFHNHEHGKNKTFHHLWPDAYDQEKKIAHFFNGCWWHGHSCQTKANTRREPNDTFENRIKRFCNAYPDVKTVTVWECEWKARKEKDLDLKKWFEVNPVAMDPPTCRLIPRQASRGGHSEAYSFYWTRQDHPDEQFIYADIISQYPDIALTKNFPTGSCQVIIGKKLEDLKLEGAEIKWNDKKLNGLIFLSIEAPKNLDQPFLLHRTKDERSVATLCSTCADQQVLSVCTHNGMERFITGVYTTVEINYALTLGYKVIHIFEAWHYEKEEPVFKKFRQLLLRNKVKFSGFPDATISKIEKEKYCQSVNAKLDLSGQLKLQSSDFTNDRRRRKYFKILSCSLMGKMGQTNLHAKDHFVSDPTILEEYLTDSSGTISDFDLLNSYCVYVRIKPNKEVAKVNRAGNCVISAFVTAHGRIQMHQITKVLIERGATVYSVEADAVAFSCKVNDPAPIAFGEQVGQLKKEYK